MQDASNFDEVWRNLDPDGDQQITRSEITSSLSDQPAEKVASVLNMPHSKRFGRRKEEL